MLQERFDFLKKRLVLHIERELTLERKVRQLERKNELLEALIAEGTIKELQQCATDQKSALLAAKNADISGYEQLHKEIANFLKENI